MFLACGLSWLPVEITPTPPTPHNAHTIPLAPISCRTECRCGVSTRQAVISHVVEVIFIAPRRALSLTHCRSPQTLSEISHTHRNVLCSPVLHSCSQIPLCCPISFSVFHRHTHTPIIRLCNDKRRRRISKRVTFDPLLQPSGIRREQ